MFASIFRLLSFLFAMWLLYALMSTIGTTGECRPFTAFGAMSVIGMCFGIWTLGFMSNERNIP